jgi:hypothetical protein
MRESEYHMGGGGEEGKGIFHSNQVINEDPYIINDVIIII